MRITLPNTTQTSGLPGLARVKAIAAGGYHTLALEGDGGPSLTSPLHDQTVAAGEDVMYAALAVGRQPMTYQWQFNGADLPGATAAVLNLTNAQAAQAGSYSVVISNDTGAVVGNAALAVLSAPVITEQPDNQAVVVGASVVFTVEAIGSAPLSYQWRHNGSSLAGATESSYSLLSVQSTNAGTYSAVLSNALGSVTSSPALLVVLLPPSITTQPSNQTAAAGEDVSFSVVADSVAALNYQWFFGTNELAGANEATLSLTNVQPANAGDYAVVVNNVAGSITSSVASLTVLAPPPPTDLLSGPGFTAAGAFQFNVGGQAGSNYVVEGSTNLSYWSALQTNTAPFSFTDTNAANLPRQFYRAHLAP